MALPTAPPSELSLLCPDRPAPDYPALSRRVGEEGTVILRVELDENGRVAQASVHRSSEHPRLDAAAITALRGWRCIMPRRDDHPLRLVAYQPFDFQIRSNF